MTSIPVIIIPITVLIAVYAVIKLFRANAIHGLKKQYVCALNGENKLNALIAGKNYYRKKDKGLITPIHLSKIQKDLRLMETRTDCLHHLSTIANSTTGQTTTRG